MLCKLKSRGEGKGMGMGMRIDNEIRKTTCCLLRACPVMSEVHRCLNDYLLSAHAGRSDVLGPLVAPPELPTPKLLPCLAARAHPPIRTRPPGKLLLASQASGSPDAFSVDHVPARHYLAYTCCCANSDLQINTLPS